jgi:hypothetical protein
MLSVLDNINDLEACKERVGADATIGIGDLSAVLRSGDGTLELTTGNMAASLEAVRNGDVECLFFIGERNNPYFTYYPDSFRSKHPEAFMRDKNGNQIQITSNPIRNVTNPVPAVDDPTIVRLASEFIRQEVSAMASEPRIRGWVIGSEEAYPDYFALPVGDFREAFREHYERYAARRGFPSPCDPKAITRNAESPAQEAWYAFREQAIADRAGAYMQAYLSADTTRPVLYPTHGHPFAGNMRRKLGQPHSLIAGACDGFEAGHIVINDDDEILNLLYLSSFTAFGVPVAAPRLGNKTLDPSAKGGGKSFTPHMLRRLVYECLGMGVWHIGPIHWRAILGDGEWAIKDTPAEAECAAVFDEIKRLRPTLSGMSRLQPSVALYVSDSTWLKAWDARWTAFMQDAIAAHWNVTIVNDAHVTAELAARIPVLISIDNSRLSESARKGLTEYTSAGGHLLVWGALGTRDVLGKHTQDFTAASGVATLDFDSRTRKRTIVNQFQTGNGAWQWPHTIRPLPIAEIEEAVLARIPARSLRPIEVQSAHPEDIEVFTLSDGFSVAATVINRSATPANVRLRLADGLASGGDWIAEDPLAPGGEQQSSDVATLDLPPHGAVVRWFRPVVTETDAAQQVAMANDAYAAWTTAGADTSFVKSILENANEWSASEELHAKASCLAQFVTSSLAIKTEAHTAPDGSLEVEARVFDRDGSPVSDARVAVRIVPGEFRFRPLQLDDSGVYRVNVTPSSLPLEYDFDRRAYSTIVGPVRLVISARNARGSGGAMLVHVLSPVDER